MFLLAALVLVVVLPSPWNALGFVVCLLLFGGEVVYWHRTMRERRATAGAETLIGQTASVVASCRPEGQVRLAPRDQAPSLRSRPRGWVASPRTFSYACARGSVAGAPDCAGATMTPSVAPEGVMTAPRRQSQ
jgi:hypothetical protein